MTDPLRCSLSNLLETLQASSSRFVLKDEERSYSTRDICSAIQRIAIAVKADPQERVAVLCGPGASQVLSMFSLWSQGAVYVPISTENTASRVDYILRDCQIKTVLVRDDSISKKYGLSDFNVLNIQEVLAQKPLGDESFNIKDVSPEETAYICYTSGSTGKPKGVMISHAAIARLARSTEEMFHWLGQDQIYLQALDYSFDASIWNVLAWLLKGGTLVSASFENNVAKLVSLILQHRLTFLSNAAPTYALLMASKKLWQRHDLSTLKTFITGGSACLPKTALELLQSFPGARLFNCYGPTETTVCCCWTEILEASIRPDQPLSIGSVLPGNQAWLYDGTQLQPADDVPEGSELELCISGDQVCQGYWNAPQLNVDKFLKSSSGERVYRTGDLVSRRGKDYTYRGRVDDTIKIKGYRVNLGEIEQCIGTFEGISTCAVLDIPKENDQTELVALYIPKQGHSLNPTSLQDLCAKELPSYMVPTQFIEKKEWPLTPSGKVDRLALKKELFQ